jgi:NAD(P)-dependent dehydrogenase (short-subunit alcohol dehydrogenase family)
MGRLTGKVAVITGGGNGIGRDTALRFLEEGGRVVITDINASNGEKVLEQAKQSGHASAIRFKKTNVAEESEIEKMFDFTLDAFGRLDCVFNNAGIGGVFGPVTDTSVEDWDYTMAVLLRGVFLGMKHGSRVLKTQGQGGSIISTSSIAGFAAGGGAHCYSAAKAAIINLTQSVAVELAEHRIRVNAVAPGPVMTDLFHRGDPDSAESIILDRQPWPDAGSGSDIAGVALFLASSDAQFVTGQTIIADGGLLAAGPALFGRGSDSMLFKNSGLDKGSTVTRAEKQ